jgi:hypothetical protein
LLRYSRHLSAPPSLKTNTLTSAIHYPARIVRIAFDPSSLQSEFKKWFVKLKANNQKLADIINTEVDNINKVVTTKDVLKKI